MSLTSNTWSLTDGRHSVHLSGGEIKTMHSLVSIALASVEPTKVPLAEYLAPPDVRTLSTLLAKLIAVATITELKEAR